MRASLLEGLALLDTHLHVFAPSSEMQDGKTEAATASGLRSTRPSEETGVLRVRASSGRTIRQRTVSSRESKQPETFGAAA